MSDRLDVGGVIRRVFDTYVEQAPVLLPASAVVFVITGIVSALLIAAAPGLALLALLLSLVATTLFTGMVVELVADIQDGRRDHTPGQLLRTATPVLVPLILVGIVAGIGIVIGFVLIIVPGLILITIWSVAAPVVVLEQPGVFAALGRSRELVRGNGWQVFGVIFVVFLISAVVGAILGAIGAGISDSVGMRILFNLIASTITAPIAALAAATIYFRLLAIKGEPGSPEAPMPPPAPPAPPTAPA
jgi:MFS family permease